MNQLVSASGDKKIRFWNANTGELTRVLHDLTYSVHAFALLPYNELACGMANHTISKYDIDYRLFETGITVNHTHSIDSLALLQDGSLASSSYKSINIWDINAQKSRILNGHSDWVTSLAALQDGHLASASYDRKILIWNTKSCQIVRTFTGHTD